MKFVTCEGGLENTIVIEILFKKTGYHGLTHEHSHQFLIHVAQRAETLKLLMSVIADFIGGASYKHIDDIFYAETFADSIDHLDNRDGLFSSLDTPARILTIVTIAAIFLFICLTEIMHKYLSATHRRLGIVSRLHEQLAADLLLGHRFGLYKFFQFLKVFTRIERYASPLPAITSGTTGLLIISFETLRDVIMNHISHIRLVYSHSERDCGDNHIDILVEESIRSVSASSSTLRRLRQYTIPERPGLLFI